MYETVMRAWWVFLIAASLLQAYVYGQDQCPPDNLSCPRDDPIIDPLDCYQTAELCNGVDFCDDGSDEGAVAALDCKSGCSKYSPLILAPIAGCHRAIFYIISSKA